MCFSCMRDAVKTTLLPPIHIRKLARSQGIANVPWKDTDRSHRIVVERFSHTGIGATLAQP